jgi:hypothetical protein
MRLSSGFRCSNRDCRDGGAALVWNAKPFMTAGGALVLVLVGAPNQTQ